jgi:outer membrane protein assembly factor BamB
MPFEDSGRATPLESWMMLARWLLLTLVASVAAGLGRAQEPLGQVGLPGENASTARRLAALDNQIKEGQHSEAVAEILRILEEVGDDLVPLDSRHSVQARWLCHLRLASPALPPPIRRLYRERVDGQVKKWWDQAEATYDVRLLRRIVAEAFCSRFADRALDVLGDLAFERGDFEEAGYWWRLLVPGSAKPGTADLVFPDPQVDVARVRAKLLLLRLARGDHDGIVPALQAYQIMHGNAQGDLAGRKGNYLETLQALVRQPQLLSPVREDPPWTTFAGDPSRNHLVPKAVGPYLVELPPIRLGDNPAAATTMPYYPVIAGGQVLVAGPSWVLGYDIGSGRPSARYNVTNDREAGKSLQAAGSRYTLTVSDKHIYARLGDSAGLGSLAIKRQEKTADSFLVCLDLQPDRQGKFPQRWIVSVPGSTDELKRKVFEGSPLVHEGRVYVALTRSAGTRAVAAIECYNASTGILHWHQDICETREPGDDVPRCHPHLVTLAGPNIVYCSHSGAIVAVDTITGRRAWAVRYPSRGLRTYQGRPSPRDLAPCVYAGGRLFTAPADADRLFCLDAATGQVRWESQRIEVVHLLGVAKGKLIFTTGLGIQAADAATGRWLIDWLVPAIGGESLPSLGRGLLAGGKVYWPTQEKETRRPNHVYVLDQNDGQPDAADNYDFSQRFGQALGNLAFGEGCLAIATADQLRIFVPAARRLEERRKVGAVRLDSRGAHATPLASQP